MAFWWTSGARVAPQAFAASRAPQVQPPSPLSTPASAPQRFTLPTPTPTPLFRTGARRAELTGLAHEWQTWNNCGPATMAMMLSHFRLGLNQADVAGSLRPNPDDKNVSPDELAAYARSLGLEALVRVNGDADVLKTLLANGLPVIVEVWLEPEPGDGFGHYRLLTGYDNDSQVWTAYDSYVAEGLLNPAGAYEGIAVPFAQLEAQWPVFHRTYVVVYAPEQRELVQFALGAAADDAAMWTQALSRAEAEIAQEPTDVFAWFNKGSALVGLQRYEEAVAAYDQAFAIGLPWRMLWYQFGPLEAYYRTGRHGDLVARANATLATTTNVEELYYWRSLGLAAMGDVASARESLAAAVALRPSYAPATDALAALEAE